VDEKKVGSKKAKVENVGGAARTKQCAVEVLRGTVRLG